jgi:trehalose 6-phosphate synthase/phosphatase
MGQSPGSLLEVKGASVAWHYRGAPREFGARQTHELRLLLGDVLSNQPLEVLEGKKVIEVRLRVVSKALMAQRVLNETGPGTEPMRSCFARWGGCEHEADSLKHASG